VLEENQLNTTTFKVYYKKYYTPLCNYAYNIVKNWNDAEEIVQNVFVKIWNSIETLTIKGSFENYVFSATRNQAIDLIRKAKKDQNLKDLQDNNLIAPSIDEDISEIASKLLNQEKLRNALEKLKPNRKQIVKLYSFEGLTQAEIAQHLNISKRSVEDNIAKAIIQLKDILNENSK
jgi:RNA polymerase sigma-70 factor (ECF subfamily)